MDKEALKSALKGLREEMLKKMFQKMDDSNEAKLEVSLEAEKEAPEAENEDSSEPADPFEKMIMDDYRKVEERKKKNAEEPGMMKMGLMNPKVNPKSFESPKKKGK